MLIEMIIKNWNNERIEMIFKWNEIYDMKIDSQ